MNVDCPLCETMVKDVNPTLGDGWDHCEKCREKIVDSPCQDIPLYCPQCKGPLHLSDYVGEYLMVGNSTHAPGKFWVFEHKKCRKFSRCHPGSLSIEKTFEEVEAQRELLP